RSSVEFLLPVKRSALAARATRSAVDPKAFRVAGPNFNPLLQNTTSTPLAGVVNGPKPSFRAASVINKGSFSAQGQDALWRALRLAAKPNWPESELFPQGSPKIGRLSWTHVVRGWRP